MEPEEWLSRQQQLQLVYETFNRRDIPAVLTTLTPDVSWPNGWEGGFVYGHDHVGDYWRRQWAQIDPVVVPTAFRSEDDGRVTVTVHQLVRTKEGFVVADQVVKHVYRFAGGLIESMEIRD